MPGGERTYAVLGAELVDLTRFLTDADIQGLALGDTVFYDVNPDDPCGQIRLLAGAWAESDYFPAAAYMADIEASVTYNRDGLLWTGFI